MPFNPIYQQGRFVSALTIAGATNNGDGTYTVSTTYTGDLHTNKTLAGFEFGRNYGTEEMSPVDQFEDNVIQISANTSLTVREMRLASAIPLLEAIALEGGYSYVRIQRTFIPPGASVGQVFAAIMVITDYNGADIVKGLQVVSMTLANAGVPPFVGLSTATIPI